MSEAQQALTNDHEKCIKISLSYDEALELEKNSVSEFSPGRVENEEIVARLIFSPLHIDDQENLLPSAFSDVKDKGLSVNRMKHLTHENICLEAETMTKEANEIPGRKERKVFGYAQATVSEIRELIEDGKRLFAVYDTALEENINHADVCAIYQEKPSNLGIKAANKGRRRQLQLLFNKILKKC